MSVRSQEIGGSLGGSKGVFRSGKKSSVKTAPTKFVVPKPVRSKTKATKAKTARAKTAAKIKTNSAKPKKISLITGASPDAATNKTGEQTLSTDAEKRFEQAVVEGNAARERRDYERAEAAYKRALTLNQRDAQTAQNLGEVYADRQMWDEAEKYHRQAIALDAANFAAHLALSRVLTQSNRGGNAAVARAVDAETFARRAIALDGRSAAAFDQLGTALEARGALSVETENAYRRAIELDPRYAVAYAHLARLLRRKGKFKDAIENYQKAVEFADDAPDMISVAEVFQTEQRYEESEKLLRRALTIDETDADALYLLGRALFVKQNLAEAERFLQRSIAIRPRAFYPNMQLGSLYLRTSRLNDAEKAFFSALTAAASSSSASDAERKQIAAALSLVGDGYLQKKMAREALRVLRKARELDAKNPQLDAKIAAAQEALAARN